MALSAEQKARVAALREATQIYRSVAGDERQAEAEIERRIKAIENEAGNTPGPSCGGM